MSSTPEFIEFAAIQIFARSLTLQGSHEEWAKQSWNLAKMLYDARPADDQYISYEPARSDGKNA
jgi:hypothetical protein